MKTNPTEGSERNATAFLTRSCLSMGCVSWHVLREFLHSSFTRNSLLSSSSPPCCVTSSLPSLPGMLPAGSTVREVRVTTRNRLGMGNSHLTAPQSLLTCARFAPRTAVSLPALKRPNFSWGTRLYPIYTRTKDSSRASSPNQGLR